MFLKKMMKTSANESWASIEKLRRLLGSADALVIGAGAGLSASAGFTYTGDRFHETFADFEKKYKFQDMYTGGFFPYKTLEEHWAYWSRYIHINRYQDAPKPVYEDLFELIKEKDYFIITTNVDHCFQKAGFDKKRLFYTQGDYGLFQCSEPCHKETYDNEKTIRRMVAEQKNMRIPTELIPRCPKCGKPMTMNLRADNTFVENEGWHKAAERYSEFLRQHENMHIVFLELGTGYNTPGIIKYSFWQMTYQWPDAEYVCINLGQAGAPKEIQKKSICINEDIGKVLAQMRESFAV